MYRESNLKCIETLDKELETLKLEKNWVDGKLAGLLKASKNLDNLIESQRKRVKRGTSRSQNGAPMRPPHRPADHRPHGAPMRPPNRPVGHRPHGPPMRPMRSNMNCARPNRTSLNKQAHSYSKRPFQETTQELMIILIQRVQRLERELKARAPIHKEDRGRSRPVMAWVPKRDRFSKGQLRDK
nr:hypothetical protein [Tanacetum cinerariifolium]